MSCRRTQARLSAEGKGSGASHSSGGSRILSLEHGPRLSKLAESRTNAGTARGASPLSSQHSAGFPHGDNVARIGGIVLELPPQLDHVGVDGPRLHVRVVAPHALEQLAARHDAIGPLHER